MTKPAKQLFSLMDWHLKTEAAIVSGKKKRNLLDYDVETLIKIFKYVALTCKPAFREKRKSFSGLVPSFDQLRQPVGCKEHMPSENID